MVRDNEVKAAMSACGVTCHTFNSDVLYEPWELLSPTGQPLVNFNDYWDRCISFPQPPPRTRSHTHRERAWRLPVE